MNNFRVMKRGDRYYVENRFWFFLFYTWERVMGFDNEASAVDFAKHLAKLETDTKEQVQVWP